MMNQKWIGFGKGTKNKKGEYIEMYFSMKIDKSRVLECIFA